MADGIAEAPETVAPEPVTEPADLSMEEFVHQKYEQVAAPESNTEKPAETPEAETPAAETNVETPEPTQAAADEPFTPEQLADPKHWDRLDKAGWERAARLHPVETARVKAGYAAASRIAEDARIKAQSSRPEPEKPAEPDVDPYQEALQKTDSLDAQERAEGFRALARLEAEKLFQESGIDPIATQATATERAAFRAAVGVLPELASLSSADLDAAVESDPDLTDDVQFAVTLRDKAARERLLSKVMVRAGRIVLSKQAEAKAATKANEERAAKAAKEAEAQRRLRSNQTNASTTVVETPTGKPPGGETTIEEFVRSKVAALPRGA